LITTEAKKLELRTKVTQGPHNWYTKVYNCNNHVSMWHHCRDVTTLTACDFGG